MDPRSHHLAPVLSRGWIQVPRETVDTLRPRKHLDTLVLLTFHVDLGHDEKKYAHQKSYQQK